MFYPIREAFTSHGFQSSARGPDWKPSYTKNFETKLGQFTVRFTDIDTTMQSLPTAYLEEAPSCLEGNCLPHLAPDNSICYIDLETVNFFPLDQPGILATCIQKVEEIVRAWDLKNHEADIEAEFSSYWNGVNAGHITTTESICSFCTFSKSYIDGSKRRELILADSGNIDAWIKARNGTDVSTKKLAIIVKTSKPMRIPRGYVWPISSVKNLFDWLKVIDQNALNTLINRYISNYDDSNEVFFCFIHKSEIVGVLIQFSKKIKAIVERAIGGKKKGGKNRIGNLNYAGLVGVLGNKILTEKFTRCSIEDATSSFLFTRNLKDNSNLCNKKIALIGCGTIGGYAAMALAQVGAGGGSGELHLFDGDVLSSGNLGRHILGVRYLMELKSEALKHYIEQQGLPVCVFSRPEFLEKNASENWDLIIDVTGFYAFSIVLANWVNSVVWKMRPILIHGWIDAYGDVARALKDEGKDACYGCLSMISPVGVRTERLPLFSAEKAHQLAGRFRRACGKTYMPFSSRASLAAAGLVQSMATDGIDANFQQVMLSSDVRDYKPRVLEKLKGCKVCQP
jgi:hypothetical protein